jgi:hypothetical protein
VFLTYFEMSKATKAAFLCVKAGLGEELQSKDELKSALQHAGMLITHILGLHF